MFYGHSLQFLPHVPSSEESVTDQIQSRSGHLNNNYTGLARIMIHAHCKMLTRSSSLLSSFLLISTFFLSILFFLGGVVNGVVLYVLFFAFCFIKYLVGPQNIPRGGIHQDILGSKTKCLAFP